MSTARRIWGEYMRTERISENKVRFILDQSDLEERNIRISELAYGSEKAKELFDDLMELAREELGVEEGPQPFMVEAIPMSQNGLVVNISRVENPDELDTRFSHFTNGIEYDHDPEGPDPEEGEEGPGDGPDSGPGFRQSEGPGFDEPGYEGNYDGPDSPENDPDLKQGPDGIQIQQGPEIRAEFSIPKSAEIDPKDIMSMIDNIVSGLAGKMGAEVRKLSGNTPSGNQSTPGSTGGPGAPGIPGKPEPKAAKPSEPDPFALYEFKDLQSVIHASKLLSMHYDSENVLYKNPVNQRYYLYLGRERSSLDEFAKLCTTLNEFGSRCRISYASKEYFEEHMTVILRDALIQLEELA